MLLRIPAHRGARWPQSSYRTEPPYGAPSIQLRSGRTQQPPPCRGSCGRRGASTRSRRDRRRASIASTGGWGPTQRAPADSWASGAALRLPGTGKPRILDPANRSGGRTVRVISRRPPRRRSAGVGHVGDDIAGLVVVCLRLAVDRDARGTAVAGGLDHDHVGATSPGRRGLVEQVGDRRCLVLTVLIDERAAGVIKASTAATEPSTTSMRNRPTSERSPQDESRT
jgi:hypothetical protein